MTADPTPPFTPLERERRKVRFAITLQTVAVVIMGGTFLLRGIVIGFDSVTVLFGLLAVAFAVILVVTLRGYQRMSS